MTINQEVFRKIANNLEMEWQVGVGGWSVGECYNFALECARRYAEIYALEPTDKQHLVKVPALYLLTIAVYGNMGDGELPDLMRVWATRQCKELGLEKELHQMQDKRHSELRMRLKNVLGDRFVSDVENVIQETMDKLLQ